MKIINKNIFTAFIIVSFCLPQLGWAGKGKVIDATATFAEKMAAAEDAREARKRVENVLSKWAASSQVVEASKINGMTLLDDGLEPYITKLPSVGETRIATLNIEDSKNSIVLLTMESSYHGFYIIKHLRKSEITIPVINKGTGLPMKATKVEEKGLKPTSKIRNGKQETVVTDTKVETFKFPTGDEQTVTTTHTWTLEGELQEVEVIREGIKGQSPTILEKISFHVREDKNQKILNVEAIGEAAPNGKFANKPIDKDEDILVVGYENKTQQISLVTKNKSGRVQSRTVDLESGKSPSSGNVIPLRPNQVR